MLLEIFLLPEHVHVVLWPTVHSQMWQKCLNCKQNMTYDKRQNIVPESMLVYTFYAKYYCVEPVTSEII